MKVQIYRYGHIFIINPCKCIPVRAKYLKLLVYSHILEHVIGLEMHSPIVYVLQVTKGEENAENTSSVQVNLVSIGEVND